MRASRQPLKHSSCMSGTIFQLIQCTATAPRGRLRTTCWREESGRRWRGQAGCGRWHDGWTQSYTVLGTARPSGSVEEGTVLALRFSSSRRIVLHLLCSSPADLLDANSIRARRGVRAVHEWISFLHGMACVAWRGAKRKRRAQAGSVASQLVAATPGTEITHCFTFSR